mmetsp:Transcript_3705/g.6521  ORF Transcript_3705/g.6521 Transcript_3705/m.6521 type:complete len:234 (-) Transcript_3705:451-1152(-)
MASKKGEDDTGNPSENLVSLLLSNNKNDQTEQNSAPHPPMPKAAVSAEELEADGEQKSLESGQESVATLRGKLRITEMRCKKLEQELEKERHSKENLSIEMERLKAVVQQLMAEKREALAAAEGTQWQDLGNQGTQQHVPPGYHHPRGGGNGARGHWRQQQQQPPPPPKVEVAEPAAPATSGAAAATREGVVALLRQAVAVGDREKVEEAIASATSAGFTFEADMGRRALMRL